jgi:hypothetical protein
MKLYDGGISIVLLILIIWAFFHIVEDESDRHERRYHKQVEQQH